MADWRTDDRELLARILTAEAGNQGRLGMTAAGNVIMNRAGRTGYGEGVRGVIMKPGQFSPMNSVTGYASGEQGQNIDSLRPSDTAYMVADSLLQGTAGDITDGATHFYNPKISNPSWAQGKEFKRIGDHVFGKADAGRGTTQNTGPMTGSNQPQRTGAPMGLLDTQPAQQPEQKKSGFWDNFAGGLLADPDRRAKIGIALEGMTLNPNRGLIQNLQSGIDTRKEQAVANRTIEWLSKQPNGAAYVEMIKAGNSPASVVQAYQSSTAQKPRSGVEVGGKLVDPTTGNVIYDPTGGATNALSPDQLTSLNSVRDDLRTELKSFEIVKSGYNNISTFYSNPSATSDYALAVAFAKILDPGSVAREGEVAAVQNAGAKVPALGQALKNALTGEGSLTPEVRQQIAELSTQIYQERLTEANQIISQYGDIAKRAGLPTDVLYSGTIPQPMQIVPAVVPAAAASQGVTQEMWDQASQDEKKHWLE